MLKTILILSVFLNFNAYAVCHGKMFSVTGIGPNPSEAILDANNQAGEACRFDKYTWAAQSTEFETHKINDYEYESTAEFQCCSAW